MRSVLAVLLGLPALAAVAEPRLKIVLGKDFTAGVRLVVPGSAQNLDGKAVQDAIIKTVGCKPYSLVRNRQLECWLLYGEPKDLVYRLVLWPRELEPHLLKAGWKALRIDVFHPPAARNRFDGKWHRESDGHHWIRYGSFAMPERVAIETGTNLVDLMVTCPQVFLAALATLLWSMLTPQGKWRYWGSVAGFTLVLALVVSSGMGDWINALSRSLAAQFSSAVGVLLFGSVLIRFASRGIAHPANCTLLISDRQVLARATMAIPVMVLVFLGVWPAFSLSPFVLLFSAAQVSALKQCPQEQAAYEAWRRASWVWPILLLLVPVLPVCQVPLPWVIAPYLTAALGVLYWFWRPARDAEIRQRVETLMGSPEPLARAAARIRESVFRW